MYRKVYRHFDRQGHAQFVKKIETNTVSIRQLLDTSIACLNNKKDVLDISFMRFRKNIN